MADKTFCDYVFVAGAKKGQQCNCFCRGGGSRCSKHKKCEHGKKKGFCVKCSDYLLCEHKKQKDQCKECAGKYICEHSRFKPQCPECSGSRVCTHKKKIDQCRECDFKGYLKHSVKTRMRHAMDFKNFEGKIWNLFGTDIDSFMKHVESLFEEGMMWDNWGVVWELDHKIPISFDDPTPEEMIKRFHFTNIQPLWTELNRSKGSKRVG